MTGADGRVLAGERVWGGQARVGVCWQASGYGVGWQKGWTYVGGRAARGRAGKGGRVLAGERVRGGLARGQARVRMLGGRQVEGWAIERAGKDRRIACTRLDMRLGMQ
eukprot:360917-Chlamydomonas_euryale.AAC.3